MKKGLAIILAFVLVFSVATPLMGENGTVLKGYVLKPHGNTYKPIKEAVVEVENIVTHEKFTSEPTGERGAYLIKGLVPGEYKVTVMVGKKKYEVEKNLKIEKNIVSFFASFVIKRTQRWALLLLGASAAGMGVYELTREEKVASPIK